MDQPNFDELMQNLDPNVKIAIEQSCARMVDDITKSISILVEQQCKVATAAAIRALNDMLDDEPIIRSR